MKKNVASAVFILPLVCLCGMPNAHAMPGGQGPNGANMGGQGLVYRDGGHDGPQHGGFSGGPQGGHGSHGGPQFGSGYDQGPGPEYGWQQGNRIPLHYFQDSSNWVNWQAYSLPQPPMGQHWIHANGAFYLTAVATGIIASVLMHP